MADGQKTEQPTQRRLHKARQEGQFPTARHFVAAMQFLAFVAMLAAWGGNWIGGLRAQMDLLLRQAFTTDTERSTIVALTLGIAQRTFVPLVAAGGLVMLATLAAQLATTKFGISTKRLTPDLKRLSPLAKLRDLPKQNLPSLVQAIVLLPVFTWAIWFIVKDNLAAYLSLPLASALSGSRRVTASIEQMLWRACMLFLFFGVVDLLRQRRRYQKEMRMSKQEIRDEVKEVEGNPLMQQRIRRIRRDLLRKRMMRQVPTATAVIVNPTHFAVAIRYDAKSMAAPVVVAKGKNFLALRIRQVAVQHEIPLVENPPLAQALYKSVEVGQEIPAHLYRAVAEILAYIFKLMRRGIA